MSRSYRKYRGLLHTESDTKQGKEWKKIQTRNTRAKAKQSEDGITEAKKCARGNCYDGECFTEENFKSESRRRSTGYSPQRVKHKLMGK